MSRALRRHPVCYRDTVPADVSADVQLPVDAQAGGSFRIHSGPQPESADMSAVIGLASPDATGDTRWEVSLNDHAVGAAEDFASAKELGGGAIRAIRIPCPLEAVGAGYNTLTYSPGCRVDSSADRVGRTAGGAARSRVGPTRARFREP